MAVFVGDLTGHALPPGLTVFRDWDTNRGALRDIAERAIYRLECIGQDAVHRDADEDDDWRARQRIGANAIATELERLGCHGSDNAAEHPLARYLEANRVSFPRVDSGGIRFGGFEGSAPKFALPLRGHVRSFHVLYINRVYPGLSTYMLERRHDRAPKNKNRSCR